MHDVDALNYSDEVWRRFENPHNAGQLHGAGPELLRGIAGDAAQGTRVQFHARLRDGRIEDARFLAYGCPCAIAAASWVAENAVGHRPEDPAWVKPLELAELLGVPDYKLGVLFVVEDAWKACVGQSPGHAG